MGDSLCGMQKKEAGAGSEVAGQKDGWVYLPMRGRAHLPSLRTVRGARNMRLRSGLGWVLSPELHHIKTGSISASSATSFPIPSLASQPRTDRLSQEFLMSGTKSFPLNRVTADQRIFPSSSTFKASAVPIESES
ncbi:hypothetical protein RJT34_16570 [Clitoria ternatea]|uniref:Uncharacterized protein n=1 Tax=Clitoria ternatea TaxID=43366 RepID=A0AAN9J7D4_CLITE